jgi:hypothetical protein
MTVHELIEYLSGCKPDAVVFIPVIKNYNEIELKPLGYVDIDTFNGKTYCYPYEADRLEINLT